MALLKALKTFEDSLFFLILFLIGILMNALCEVYFIWDSRQNVIEKRFLPQVFVVIMRKIALGL